MVAAASGPASAADHRNPKTTAGSPPLPPSQRDDKNGISSNPKKTKSKPVSSRYMSSSPSNPPSVSSSPSRRFPSPSFSKHSNNTPSLSSKRSVSVDRRQTSVAGDVAYISAATKLLMSSTRSLSVSFQGESFSLPVSKTKVNSVRNGTPERRRTVAPSRSKAEGLLDQHRWPARNRTVENPLSRSLDCSGEKSNLIGSVNRLPRLQASVIPKMQNMVHRGLDRNLANNNDITTSDSDSVSSESTSGPPGCGNRLSRGMAVSPRFWQETNSRLRRLQDPVSPLATSPGSRKLIVAPKSKRFTGNGLLSSPSMISSPIRGGIVRLGSPNKVIMTPPSRGNSPSRARNVISTISNCFSDTPSVLSFAVDVRRGKVGDNKILDAHFLRLLYNRQLQWRFVNARSDGVLQVQQRSVKKHLWNAWITISDLRDTVTKKRHRLQLLKQKLKLATILKGQTTFLEDWASLEKDHLISLLGAIEGLTASTLRLPIIGAIGDVQRLKEALGSAFDIMQAMTSSIYLLLPMAEKVNSLVSELAKVTTKEEALLEQCMHVVSTLSAMQVKDSSLRTHIIQHTPILLELIEGI